MLDQPRDRVLELLIAAMDEWATAAADRVLARWRELSSTLGRRVRVDVGSKSTEGLAEDLGPNGELIVDGFAFVAGSVTHL
jgi:biotin-(acetyl-CoA carboxylase) ligase